MRDYGPGLNDLRRALGGVLARSGASVAQVSLSQRLPLWKAPLDVMRGTSGEEKVSRGFSMRDAPGRGSCEASPEPGEATSAWASARSSRRSRRAVSRRRRSRDGA